MDSTGLLSTIQPRRGGLPQPGGPSLISTGYIGIGPRATAVPGEEV